MQAIHLTIRAKILLSLCIVILLMGTANVLVVIQMLNYSRQYDAIINNITTANSISGSIKPDIDNEMWNIVAGKIQFNEGKQYEIINNINSKIQWMMENTDSQRAKVKLDVVLRTMQHSYPGCKYDGETRSQIIVRQLKMRPYWKKSGSLPAWWRALFKIMCYLK